MMQLKLSDEERKNGWTEESLRAYIRQRELAQADTVFPDQSRAFIIKGQSTYNPKKDF